MSQDDKFCPTCDARRHWYDERCPECDTPLEALPARYATDPDRPLVTVLTAVDPGLLPLARLTLDEARIEFSVAHSELTGMLGGRQATSPAGSGDQPWVIQVRESDAARARELLVDLENATTAEATPLELSDQWAEVPPPVEIFESETGHTVGHMTDEQLDWLSGELEEQAVTDREFTVDAETIASYAEAGADPAFVELLRGILGTHDVLRLRWARM